MRKDIPTRSENAHLVRVYAIVDERPAYPACVEGQTDVPVRRARDGGPAEERAPVKRQA